MRLNDLIAELNALQKSDVNPEVQILDFGMGELIAIETVTFDSATNQVIINWVDEVEEIPEGELDFIEPITDETITPPSLKL